MGIHLFRSLLSYNCRTFFSKISSGNNHTGFRSRRNLCYRISSGNKQTSIINVWDSCGGADGKSVQVFSALSTENLSVNYELNPPLTGDICGCTSCNGLLCLNNVQGDTLIWNPSLDESSEILRPPPASLPGQFILQSSWFGFDPKSNDYKLLFFSYHYPPHEDRKSEDGSYDYGQNTHLYSLKHGSWKTMPDSFTGPWESLVARSCRVKHRHYWLSTFPDSGEEYILSFGLDDEEFSVLPLPDIGSLGHQSLLFGPHTLELVEFDGMLAAIVYLEMQVEKTYHVWVFEDGLWTREFSIRVSGVEKPLGFGGNKGQYLFLRGSDHQLKVFDCATGELKSIDSCSGPTYGIIPHVETLVPVN